MYYIEERDVDIELLAGAILTLTEQLDLWLNSSKGYQSITFDDGTVLKAVLISEIDVNEVVKNFGELTLEFSAYREVK